MISPRRKKFNREVISAMLAPNGQRGILADDAFAPSETLDEFKEHLQFQVMSDHIRWKSLDGNWHFLWHYEAEGDEFPDLDETKSNEGLKLKALLEAEAKLGQ